MYKIGFSPFQSTGEKSKRKLVIILLLLCLCILPDTNNMIWFLFFPSMLPAYVRTSCVHPYILLRACVQAQGKNVKDLLQDASSYGTFQSNFIQVRVFSSVCLHSRSSLCCHQYQSSVLRFSLYLDILLVKRMKNIIILLKFSLLWCPSEKKCFKFVLCFHNCFERMHLHG